MISVACLLYSNVSIAADTLKYTIDQEHTELGFEVAHLVISSVKGRFDKFDGYAELNEKSILTKVEGKAIASSINTNQEKRDKHLRSADFFDVEKFPELSFKADKLNIKPGKKAKVKATLNMRGIAREITLELDYKGKVTDPWGTEKIVLNATANINRKDFGLTWNEALETGGVMVGDKIKIIINAQANKVTAATETKK